MKTLGVLQHTETLYLGLMEDHLEGRNLRFDYLRPFVPNTQVPASAAGYAALVLLGAGPFGIVSGNLLPSLGAEIRLARDFLARGLPVIGFELGGAILAGAAGGGAEEAPLRFSLDTARRATPGALGGHMPERFPAAFYGRDRAIPPQSATLLATGDSGAPLAWRAGTAFGFAFHPGTKRGMVEDLVMEFDEVPDDIAAGLALLAREQSGIAEALGPLMVGLVAETGLMAT